MCLGIGRQECVCADAEAEARAERPPILVVITDAPDAARHYHLLLQGAVDEAPRDAVYGPRDELARLMDNLIATGRYAPLGAE